MYLDFSDQVEFPVMRKMTLYAAAKVTRDTADSRVSTDRNTTVAKRLNLWCADAKLRCWRWCGSA